MNSLDGSTLAMILFVFLIMLLGSLLIHRMHAKKVSEREGDKNYYAANDYHEPQSGDGMKYGGGMPSAAASSSRVMQSTDDMTSVAFGVPAAVHSAVPSPSIMTTTGKVLQNDSLDARDDSAQPPRLCPYCGALMDEGSILCSQCGPGSKLIDRY